MTLQEMITQLDLSEGTLTALQTAEGQTFTAAANEFLSAIVNKICYQVVETTKFVNPFAKYKKFDIEYGETIENVFVEVPSGYDYNKDATDPFTKQTPSVQTLYLTINFERQYEVTVQADLIRRAVLSKAGFDKLVNTVITSLGKSADLEDYAATLKMLNNTDIMAGGAIQQLDVSALATDEDKAKAICTKMVDVSSSFKQPVSSNNNLGVLNPTLETNILLVVKRDVLNKINLDYLAGIYNLAKVDLIKNIIEVESFQYGSGDSNIDFMVLDEEGFDIHQALRDNGQIYNPKGRYFNHFSDNWKAFGFKRWANCKAFTIKWTA